MAPHAAKLTGPARFVRRPLWPRRTRGPVLLTFDDGPHPHHTAAVLDRLDRFGLSAAFFVLGGRVPGCEPLLRRMHAAGHRIGNHTSSHPRPTWFGFRSAHRQLADCQRAVTAATGTPPALFRPPMGRWSPPLRLACRRHRLRPMTWTLDSGDWRVRSDADAERCGEELALAVRPGDVVLLHDYHPWVGRILDVLLPGLAN
jgi:peptidoglycan/xylan/chitin deacetylase (PgdA/CDA1 family)